MRMFRKHRISAVVTSAVMSVGSLCAMGGTPSASAADANYARLLQYSLYFYDANMCGDMTGCGLSWRGNCHMSDDVVGGFHDAGDHAMFGQPQGYTASTLGWAYYEFSDAFIATGQADHLKFITDRFCKFFRDCTEMNGNTVSRVLIEKGEGNIDHAYWGPPEQQGSRGRMLWTTGGAANVTAEYAASLAVNYLNFKNPDDLKYAEALYDFSLKDTGYYTAAGGGDTFYEAKWTGSTDEINWAAGWLYLATKNDKYLTRLKSAGQSYSNHSWESVQLGAGMLKGIITGDWGSAGFLDNFRGDNYCFLENWEWGSARQNCTAQFCTLVAANHNKGGSDWAKGQMDYILGKKGVGSAPARCFVVGFDSTSPVNVHHRAASGYTSYDDMGNNTAAKQGSPVLVGALAGGPGDANGTYSDSLKDYKCNEVALDYNAGFVGAAAGLYHFYKSGTIDNNIVGVTKIYSSSSVQQPDQTTPQQPDQTDAPKQTDAPTQTDAPEVSKSGDTYTIKVNQAIDYDKLPENDKMIGFKYADFGLTSTSKEKIKQVKVNISSNNNIGKWEGAFGSSTKDANADPQYWTQTKDMSQNISGNKGTIVWDVPSATADIIQYGYGGEVKFGVWWIDCKQFTIDSVELVTDGNGSTSQTEPQQPDQTDAPQQTEKQGLKVTKRGDADTNGDVNVADAVLLARYNAEDRVTISDQGLVNTDLDGNGKWNSNDLTKLLEIIAGLSQ